IAENDTLVDGKIMGAVPGKLHDLIVGAVGSDIANDSEDQISGIDAFPQGAVQVKTDRFRNHHPGSTGGHGVEKICTTDAGTESAQRPIGGSVRVCTEDQLARADIVFHHDLMADALSLIQLNAMVVGEIPHFLMRLGSFWILRRYVMIHDKDNLI